MVGYYFFSHCEQYLMTLLIQVKPTLKWKMASGTYIVPFYLILTLQTRSREIMP